MRARIVGMTALATVGLVLSLHGLSCTLLQSGVQAFADMTPRQRAIWLMSVYNAEYNSYKAKAAQPEKLTEADREIMRAKKQAMLVAWPAIKAYCSMIDSGGYTLETEQAALSAIEVLTKITFGGVSDARTPGSGGD